MPSKKNKNVKTECLSPVHQPIIAQPGEEELRRPSTSDTDMVEEFDYSFGGIDVREQLPGTSSNADHNDAAFRAFLRNEISYNQYSEITGEERVESEGSEDEEEVEDEEIDVVNMDPFTFTEGDEEPDDEEEEEIGVPDTARPPAKRPKKPMSTVLNQNLLQSVPTDLKSQLVVNDSGEFSAPKEVRRKSTAGSKKMGLAPMDALIGQANLAYARGKTTEAIKMLLEVIRQNPRDPEAYLQVSQMYNEMDKPLEALQYGLLGAHLTSKTPAGDWSYLGDLALQLDRSEEAAACYFKAMRMDPSNWVYYEKRISVLDKLGLTSLSMKTRLMAAHSIDHIVSNVDFEWFEDLIKSVADYYITTSNETKAMEALEAFVTRSHQFGLYAAEQHQLLLGMWIKHEKFDDAAKSIFALCPGIKPMTKDGSTSLDVLWSNSTFKIKPWPNFHIDKFAIEPIVASSLITNLAICLIRMGKPQSVNVLVEHLTKRPIPTYEEAAYLDIARAYIATQKYDVCHLYLKILSQLGTFVDNPETWYLMGLTCTAKQMPEEAINSYERVLSTHPEHVDARINLSNIQQNLGYSDKALETLKGHDLDQCTHLPDERLLIRQADMLYAKKEWDQYVRCVRMLLTPHFYQVHLGKIIIRTKRKNQQFGLDNGLRNVAICTLRGTAWEKFVKRLGAVASREERSVDELKGTQLHDYAFKLMEVLHEQRRFHEMLCVCCYAFLQAKINSTGRTFLHLLLYASIRAHNWMMAFEYVRWFHQSALVSTDFMGQNRELLFSRIFNAMNFVFCHSQNVCYHRYVMRALVRTPGNHPLQMISGNNSLITGSYRHALGEYLKVWHGNKNRNDPMVCMLIGLTFIHISCKKDISSRHMVALRGFAFMRQYEKLRGECQETLYNIGRMFHQMGMTSMAIHFYERLLNDSQAPKVWVVDEETGEKRAEVKEQYDLKPLAAHNLSLIYESCGNFGAARAVLEKYCVV
ncbi:hypothetical protein QR680_006576 [Steinernema hermaphroditum]|uniref:General transcription factor 3C polypeptide 3 n=1 Tax=Steinernema hermaphroditum TaxID=289476 RepID=A0AA39HVV8_9BILA|nr:hypothetical protein QR680_006576 [Steinernema hermaphroditum]